MTQAPQATTKNVIVELVLLGLSLSKLKDTGLSAMRGVLLSDARLAVLDGAVDLQAVWDLLEAQPGWDPNAALGPLSFVKSLEHRLQVKVKLPAAMGKLSESEIVRYAATTRPKRDDIERAIRGDPPEKKRFMEATAPLPQLNQTSDLPRWKKILFRAAIAVTVLAVGFLAYAVYDEVRGPAKATTFAVSDVGPEIPLKSAERWGGEVHAVLADASWMKLPEPKRREQLERALRRLSDHEVSVLVLEDDAKRVRASAQLFGKPPKLFVKFY